MASIWLCLDSDYRTAHHGDAVSCQLLVRVVRPWRIDVSGDELVTVIEKDDLRISAFG